MKFVGRLAKFALTIILGLIAFTYVAIKFPVMMRDLLVKVQNARDGLLQLNLLDNYSAWVSIIFTPNLCVVIGFAIVIQLLLEIMNTVLKSWRGEADSNGASPSPVAGLLSSGWS